MEAGIILTQSQYDGEFIGAGPRETRVELRAHVTLTSPCVEVGMLMVWVDPKPFIKACQPCLWGQE